MTQVLRGRAQGDSAVRCYLEVMRTDDVAILASLDGDGSVTLQSHPLTWFEIGEQYTGGKREFAFDTQFMPLTKGEKHYPTDEAARKLIRGCYGAPAGFKNGALSALVDVLPSGDIHLFTQEEGFIGRFANKADAEMIAKASGCRPVIFGSAVEVKGLAATDLGIVLTALDPEKKWPAKLKQQHFSEVFEMAKKKVKAKAKKVVKAEARQKRADGPVNKARELFATMRDKPTADIIAAAVAQGINKNTAQTQLGRWRKENGIKVARGGTRKPKAAAEKPDPKATAKGGDAKGKKAKGKGKKAKKKDAKPAPGAAPAGAAAQTDPASTTSGTDTSNAGGAAPAAGGAASSSEPQQQ